jgi:hypothetical protein
MGIPTLTGISDTVPLVEDAFPFQRDPRIRVKDGCLDIDFDRYAIGDDQLLYEFPGEHNLQRVEVNLAAGTVISIVVVGVPELDVKNA